MDRSLIINPDAEAERFLDEYLDATPTVTAYTSGSTGTPKEIALPKLLMRASARATNEVFGIRRGDLLLCPLSAKYIASRMMMVRALEAGARCLMLPPSMRPLEAWDGEEEARLIPVVPAQVAGLLEDSTKYTKLKNVLVGGGTLSSDLEKALLEAPFETLVSYGMTETCSHVALRRLADDHYTALPGYEFSTDERQCLVIDRDKDIHLVTNDIVKLLDNHTFEWQGRYDNVINSGGIKFFPEQLERCLETSFPAGTFYFTSLRSERWGEELVAVIMDEKISVDSFLAACRRLLPSPYAVPKSIYRHAPDLTPTSTKLRRRKF